MNQSELELLNKPTKWFTAIFRMVIAVFMLFALGTLIMQAFTATTGMEIILDDGDVVSSVVQYIRKEWESVIYYQDNVLANLVFLVVGFFLLWFVTPRLPLWAESLLIAFWTIALGVLWVKMSQVAPSADSGTVSSTAINFAKENYEMLTGSDRYFRNYSFQLGFVFFEEILIRIASLFKEEINDLIFIQEISAILLASAYVAILHVLDLVCEDKRIRHTAFLLLALCVQPILSCVFLYGIIPGFAFAAWAVYLEIRFLKSDSWKGKLLWGILSAICITISVVIKSNNLIVLVAMVLLAGVTAFQNKKTLCNLILVVACVIPCAKVPDAIIGMYEKRAGTDLGDSIPMISWFSLGMNEGFSAPGWYNYGATLTNFEICEFDADAAAKRSKEAIRDRMNYFQENKQYRNDFFYKKYVSMWNETTYQCIWNNTVRGQYNPKTGIAKLICEEKQTEAKQYMDYFSQLVFVLCFFGIIYCVKEKNTYLMIMPLIVMGGMLYHFLAEAKSQYALPYFIWMTVFASCGFVFLQDWMKPCLCQYLEKLHILKKTGKPEKTETPGNPERMETSENFENSENSEDFRNSEYPEYFASFSESGVSFSQNPENPVTAPEFLENPINSEIPEEIPDAVSEVEQILKNLEHTENGA